jgi:menaquinone-dependent protoporphyrinogen IX oxidase
MSSLIIIERELSSEEAKLIKDYKCDVAKSLEESEKFIQKKNYTQILITENIYKENLENSIKFLKKNWKHIKKGEIWLLSENCYLPEKGFDGSVISIEYFFWPEKAE